MSVSDPNGNAVAQELNYRGFSASSLQGAPQGLAVYMNGIRLNEAFGDTVNWDLIPTNVIERADLWTNNPVFGLNALGGAINLQTKNGFTYQGFEGDVQGGSFGRVSSEAQYGVKFGDRAVYVAGQVLHDGGWRFQSPVTLARGYGDIGWRDDRGRAASGRLGRDGSFGATAATPVDLLELDKRAVYTTPQTTQNSAGSLALNGKWSITDTWQLQGNAYVRRFQQDHDDGNPADIERCSNSASPPFRNHLCLEDDGFPRPNPVTAAFRDQFAILDPANNPIPCPPGSGNPCNTTPYGTIDRTMTGATTTGISLQATNTDTLFGHKNRLVAGGSIDHGNVNFQSSSTLGFLNSNLVVVTNPEIPGNGSLIHTLGGFGYVPVNIDTRNTYYGLYALNVFDVTEPLSLTLGGRLNIADIGLSDQLGTTPELNGSHSLHAPQSGHRVNIQAHSAPYRFRQLFDRQPRADAGGTGLCRSLTTLPDRKFAGGRSSVKTSGRSYLRDRLAGPAAARRWRAAMAGRAVSHEHQRRHHLGRQHHLGTRVLSERSRHAAPGFRDRVCAITPRNGRLSSITAFSMRPTSSRGDLPSPNNPMAGP